MDIRMPQLTLVEKIATAHAEGLAASQAARSGAIVTIRPRHIMTHDNTSAVMGKFAGLGASAMHDPKQPVFAIDHDIQNHSPENMGKYAKIEKFAHDMGVDFYPAGTGISHQVMVEEGYAVPGAMVVGSDSHSNMYGAMCALGTPVVRTDAASIWAIGTTWWQVPKVAQVRLVGTLQPGVVGKDVIIALCGVFNNDEVLNHAVEFAGDGVGTLSMDERMSIANMTTEWGALAGVFPFDDTLEAYLRERAAYLARKSKKPRLTDAHIDEWKAAGLHGDPSAEYAVELELDLATIIPHVSGPDHVKVMRSLPEIERDKVRINKAYLLSCVNARLADLQAAAAVVAGKRVADHVEFYMAAASANVQCAAEKDGTWQTLLDAGARALPPGCGTCIGLGAGTLEPGEVGISATNRNFKGRMGARDAKAYLASPAVVAASAVAGYICAPNSYEERDVVASAHRNETHQAATDAVEMIDGFPTRSEGRMLWLPVENLNTDGIYSGVLTYRDDVSDDDMAAAAMENYDPTFKDTSEAGDIIVAGRNFGTGSSREQAATCLKLRGIACVIAESFSETYRRNAFNNGFVCLECPGLVTWCRERFASNDGLTIVGPSLTVDWAAGTVAVGGESFAFPALSPTAQELIVAGGAEPLVRARI